MADSSYIKCAQKIRLNRDAAIKEALRLGYPVIPYRCFNGADHWHVGHSIKGADDFYHHRTRWEDKRRNRDI